MTELSKNKEVLAALKSLAESGALGAAERRARLLAYLLEEELAGRGETISAYSIGVDVLGRPEDFDPNTDAIVRAEMGRLRKALDHHYETTGRLDDVQIRIPSRSNRPEIRRKSVAKAPRTSRVAIYSLCLVGLVAIAAVVFQIYPTEPAGTFKATPFEGPRVAVLDFNVESEDRVQESFGHGLRVEMVTELSRFDWLSVFVSNQDDPTSFPDEVGYYLAGDIRADGEQMIATLSMLKPKTGELLWSHRYQIDRSAGRLIEFQQQAAEEIAVQIARPEGLIADLEKRRVLRDTTESDLAYSCIFRLYEFWRTVSPEDHGDLLNCLTEALKIAPDYAEAHAAMSFAYVEEARGLGIEKSVDNPLERAEFHSRKALELNEKSSLAVQATLEVMSLKGDLDEVRKIGEIALQNAPNNPDLLADYGLVVSLRLGHYEEGKAFTDRAMSLNPDPPLWYYYPAAMEAYFQGDYEETLELTDKVSRARPIITSAMMMGLEARLGNMDAAEQHFAALVPHVAADLDELVEIISTASGFHEKYINRLAQDYQTFERSRLAN